jgi:hypothetical protein
MGFSCPLLVPGTLSVSSEKSKEVGRLRMTGSRREREGGNMMAKRGGTRRRRRGGQGGGDHDASDEAIATSILVPRPDEPSPPDLASLAKHSRRRHDSPPPHPDEPPPPDLASLATPSSRLAAAARPRVVPRRDTATGSGDPCHTVVATRCHHAMPQLAAIVTHSQIR